MSRYRISRRARAHLKEIWKYVARHSESAADRVVGGLLDRFRFLASHPLVGTLRNDLSPGLRLFSAGTYVIFFSPTPAGVEIVAVFHGSRDYDSAFRRDDA